MAQIEGQLSRTRAREAATTGPRYEGMPPLFKAIQSCLLFIYDRHTDEDHGIFLIWRSMRSSMSARIYPCAEKDTITVAVFDDTVGELTGSIHDGTAVRLWTSDIRVTGDWRRRLRRAQGEALVLAQRRPRCPDCRGAEMILKTAGKGTAQFFSCIRFETRECRGATGIIDHDLERK